MSDLKYNLLAIVGPTACGKTEFAVQVANVLNTEIISADSRQIYRGMDIGTGKDISEYTISGKKIPHHLLDIVDAGYKYNVYEYQRDFIDAFEKVKSKNILPILCGGTGLYIEAVLKGYKMVQVPPNETLQQTLKDKSLLELREMLSGYKKLHNTSDTETKRRAIRAIEIEEYYKSNPDIDTNYPEIKPLVVGLDIYRDLRRAKISKRLKLRLEEGMIDEVKGLINSGVDPEDLIYYGLEYKFVTQHVIGELSFDEMYARLEIAIHQFAKRQMTWFRGMEKRGTKINWLDIRMPLEEKLQQVQDWLLA